MPVQITFPPAVKHSVEFKVGGNPCIVTRVDDPAEAKGYAPARPALYSLQIGCEVIVYSTEEHIRALIAALEHDASLAEQAAAERFLESHDAKWTKVEKAAPSPGGSKKIEWHG